MTHTSPPTDNILTWAMAYDALEAGDSLQAEGIAVALVEAARASAGDQSTTFAAALSELSILQMTLHKIDEAARNLRRAWSIPAHTEDDHRARLTHNMNLGSALQLMGQLDEAEAILREGLALRKERYGDDHAGTAYGLSTLAETLEHKGELQEAHDLTEDAILIFWTCQHPQVADCLVQLAWIRAATNTDPLDIRLDKLSEDYQLRVLHLALSRASRSQPEPSLLVLEALWRWAREHRGDQDRHTLNLAAATSNQARPLHANPLRIETATFPLKNLRQIGTDTDKLGALLALALAHSEADEKARAEELYQEATTLSGHLKDPSLHARALRNHGLFLAQQDRCEEADILLAQSITQTASSDEKGSSLVAYGIFLQHSGDLERAQPMLEEALTLLSPEDPDAICGRSHLSAITEDHSCGCGDMNDALADTLTQMVKAQIPDDLLNYIALDPNEGLKIVLQREGSEEEMELLQRAVTQATAQLRQQDAK